LGERLPYKQEAAGSSPAPPILPWQTRTMEILREEILQSERVRSELLKWKLGLVGALGALGLGFAGTDRLNHADLVLCAIPPVCVYVDLLCRHLTLKMLVVGRFLIRLKESGNQTARTYAAYEELAQDARAISVGGDGGTMSAFALEDWALWLSTVALSGAIIVYGVAVWSEFSIPFVFSGAAGLLATAVGGRQYSVRFRAVETL
jgi:hypothetical protein